MKIEDDNYAKVKVVIRNSNLFLYSNFKIKIDRTCMYNRLYTIFCSYDNVNLIYYNKINIRTHHPFHSMTFYSPRSYHLYMD